MQFEELDLCILKVILTNKKNALDFVNNYDDKLFSPELWNAANIIISYIKTYKELPTLRVILEKNNKQQTKEYFIYVFEQIDKIKYDEKEFKHDLDKLKTRFAENQILNIKERFANSNIIDINKNVNDMQRAIQNIKSLSKTKSYERKTLKNSLQEFSEEYNYRSQNPNSSTGILTKYSYLDSVTDGLNPGELLIIGGESSAGKSMLLMNLAVQMWMQDNNIDNISNFSTGHDLLYFSLEMPFKPCMNRVLARLSGVPSRAIKKAKLSSEQMPNLNKALKFIKKYPHEFEIIDIPRGATIENIELIYEDCKTLFNPKIVVIDYLGLMEDNSSKESDDWLKLGKIAGTVHEFARAHNIIVLSAVQLNRMKPSKNDEEGRIGMHRIGRSSLIMHHANIGVQIETRVQEKSYPDMIYHVIKCRDGELGKGKLLKRLDCGTLSDIPTISESQENVDDISAQAELIEL